MTLRFYKLKLYSKASLQGDWLWSEIKWLLGNIICC